MDRGELRKVCARVMRDYVGVIDVRMVALALDRFLAREERAVAHIGRVVERNRRQYQREYMRDYRAGRLRRKERKGKKVRRKR